MYFDKDIITFYEAIKDLAIDMDRCNTDGVIILSQDKDGNENLSYFWSWVDVHDLILEAGEFEDTKEMDESTPEHMVNFIKALTDPNAPLSFSHYRSVLHTKYHDTEYTVIPFDGINQLLSAKAIMRKIDLDTFNEYLRSEFTESDSTDPVISLTEKQYQQLLESNGIN